mmetsp:Transcript_105027/g.234424  ORF Transcript_105027/g.234424 Transcript_105027/m.234424 type:complete len:251 (+) Transcript_105027:72-824(+)
MLFPKKTQPWSRRTKLTRSLVVARKCWLRLTNPFVCRVVCLGDSITYGLGLEPHRDRDCYPSILQRLLGCGFSVHNCGVSGCSASDTSDAPCRQTVAYKRALALRPDALVILLGTNDCIPSNWARGGFAVGLRSIFEDFATAVAQPPVLLLCTPPPLFIGEPYVAQHGPLVQELMAVAGEAGVEVLELHRAMADEGLFFDGVHPNCEGARRLAEEVAVILQKLCSPPGQPRPKLLVIALVALAVSALLCC